MINSANIHAAIFGSEAVTELVKTGIVGLDEILHGGFPRNNNLIVEGPPGSS
jgi:hypothetical protein